MLDPAVIQRRIGHDFRNADLLTQALTHTSFANENRSSVHNERLEFLGDAVLTLIVSEHLMASLPEASEGVLSKQRASIVSESSLAAAARELGLGAFLLLGRGEEQTGGRDKDSVLANSLEAVLAAVYLDAGMERATKLVQRLFGDVMARATTAPGPSDHKTELQELCQERLKLLPEYRVVSQSGPDHQKQFTVELTIQGKAYGSGTGRSKKEAEQLAARQALELLRRSP